ncbi:hypothetical protein JCM3774_000702 [Rhodotorula dairenensis]
MQAQTAAASTTNTDEVPLPSGQIADSAPPQLAQGSGERTNSGASTAAKVGGGSASINSSDGSRRPVLSRVNTAVGGSFAAAAELLPSPACVTSSSAVIWNGLERIGSALSATASRARTGSIGGGGNAASSKGKERETDRPGEEGIASSAQMRRRDSNRPGSQTPPVVDGVNRRVKGKKGKTATTGGSQIMSPTTSSQGFTSALPSPAISRRGSEKADSARASDRNAALQPLSSLPGDFPTGQNRRLGQQLDDVAPIHPPARFEKPPDPTLHPARPASPPPPPPQPPKTTSHASVQTSPRLLPLPASPPLPASNSDTTPPHNAPLPVLSMSPLRPFDLHASFQATPASSSTEPLLSLADYSVTNETSHISAASPPISPHMSRAPSATESASSSSPTSRRAGSPGSPPIPHARPVPQRRGSAVSVNGHLAVGTPERTASGNSSPALAATRSRKAARKASANEIAQSGQQQGVVGLPGAVAAPRRSSEAERADRARSVKGSGSGGSKSPKDDAGSVPVLPRRTSASGSGASANSGSKSAEGGRSNAGDDPYHQHHHHHQHQQQQRWPIQGDRIYGYAALGIRNEDDDDLPSEGGGSELDRRSSSAAGEGYLPAGFSSRAGHFMSPETSPHPSQRSVSSSQYAPSSQRTPWSPHLTSQYAPVMSSPSAHSVSRPPSRGSSLSVPVAMTPMSAAGTMQQQQQQQAFALAQSQLQTQSQLMLQYQQIQAVQQRSAAHPSHVPPLRRRATSGGLSETSDGLLSPTATAIPATPNGFGFPFGALTSPLIGSSPNGQPAWPMHPSGLTPHMMPYSSGPASPYPGLSQTSSPTTASFPNSAFSPQVPPHAMVAHANGMYQCANTGAGAGYSASPNSQAAAYGQVQPSPTHGYFSAAVPSQQQRNNSLPYPTKPRLSSSMSAGGTHGSGGGGNGKPSNSSASNTKRGNIERSHSIPSAPLSGGVSLGDPPPAGWKGKLKQAELDADRMGKELEIARWRLAVVEEEQRAAERESQEALKALAARAMRAEARIRLFEATSGRSEPAEEAPVVRAESRAGASTPSNGSPSVRAANTSTDEVTNEDATAADVPPTVEILPKLQLNGSTSADDFSESPPDKPIHPLAWLDLDAVSFGNNRPLRQADAAPSQNSPRLAASRRRNGRSSHPTGETGRRRPTAGQRRKSALNNQGPPAAEAELSDDEEVVIVLDAPLRRRPPIPHIIPSRRSSYVDDDGLERDGNSVCGDDDDVPPIDIDDGAEPLAGGIVIGEGDEDTHEHPAYIGFLPAYLSGPRPTPTATILPKSTIDRVLSEEEEPVVRQPADSQVVAATD